MKLGICYMVFDGEELLEFAIKSIRNQIDHIAVTYQTTSYFGNPCGPELIPTLEKLKSLGLIDELIFFEPNLSLHHKENEVALRNIGLEASQRAGCTHHISADTDDFYQADQLEYAKKVVDEGNYDFTMAPYINYYKDPTFLVTPIQNLVISFIHPVNNKYDKNNKNFPFKIEPTRKLTNHNSYKLFTLKEITIHHMSFIRKDIRKKFANNDNKNYYQVEQLITHWENYQLGGRVTLLPDQMNRKTTQVPNQFGIHI
jgi:hypothetical protein